MNPYPIILSENFVIALTDAEVDKLDDMDFESVEARLKTVPSCCEIHYRYPEPGTPAGLYFTASGVRAALEVSRLFYKIFTQGSNGGPHGRDVQKSQDQD